jgi:hypothetical protein
MNKSVMTTHSHTTLIAGTFLATLLVAIVAAVLILFASEHSPDRSSDGIPSSITDISFDESANLTNKERGDLLRSLDGKNVGRSTGETSVVLYDVRKTPGAIVAFVSLVDKSSGLVLPSDSSSVVIFIKVEDSWRSYLVGDPAFDGVLRDLPETLLNSDAKTGIYSGNDAWPLKD